MQLYGHPWSIHTREVRMVLAEKDHTATLHLVDLPTGEQRAPAHLARHPFGKVPALDDDGFVVYETAAIVRYLDERLPGVALQPAEPRARARALQWDRVHQSYFEPHARPLLVHRIFARHLGFAGDAAVIAAGRAGMQPALDVLDRHLTSAPYLAGDRFSHADITWLPFLEYLQACGEDAPLRERPHVAAWWSRIGGRPTWAAVARTGPQPYDPTVVAGDIVRLHR